MSYPKLRSLGTTAKPLTGYKTNHNFDEIFARTRAAAGDVRLVYHRLYFTGATGGETYRIRATVDGAQGSGQTVNAEHVTLDITTAGTISGAANAARFTLACGAVVPGGTLSVLQLCSDLADGAISSGNDNVTTAFIRCSQDGTHTINSLLALPATEADGHTATVLSTAGVDQAATHYIGIMLGSTRVWLMATTTAPAHS